MPEKQMGFETKMEMHFEEWLILLIIHAFIFLPLTGPGIVSGLLTVVLLFTIVSQEMKF